MEQSPVNDVPTLESNLDHLAKELHQLASRVKPTEQDEQRDDNQ